MNTEHDDNGIPDWKLERFRLGELPDDELTSIRSQLKRDAELRARVDALELSDRELLSRYPARWMSNAVEARQASPSVGRNVPPRRSPGRTRPRRVAWAWAAVPITAVLLVLLIPQIAPDRPSTEPRGPGDGLSGSTEGAEVRIKGNGPALHLIRQTASGAEGLADSDYATEGDLILIQYDPAGRRYGCIFSVDGRGVLTQHLPVTGDSSASLESDQRQSVEFAYELDDAPRWERFYFLASEEPFALDPVRDVLEAATDRGADQASLVGLPATLDLSVFTLRKEHDHE